MAGLRPVVTDAQLEVLQLLVDRRRSIGEEHTRKVGQLHRILLEMLPAGAKKYLSAARARTILAGVRPRGPVGKTGKRVAMELVVDLERIYAPPAPSAMKTWWRQRRTPTVGWKATPSAATPLRSRSPRRSHPGLSAPVFRCHQSARRAAGVAPLGKAVVE